MSRLCLVLAVAALVAAASGCGESSSPGAAGASVAPAATQVFVSVDTSFDSPAWENERALLAKFPDGDAAVAWLVRRLGSNGVDFEQDVKPALGPETDVVGLDMAAGRGRMVVLTQPDDRAKLDALLRQSDTQLYSREIDGWTAVSDSEANLDELESLRKDGTLDGVDAYQKVSGQVPGDGLLQAYVAPSALSQTPLAGIFGSAAPSLAVSLKPEEDGIHVEGAASPASGDLFSDEFTAELPAELPGGVYLYAGTSDLEAQLGALRDALAQAAPNIDRDLARAEAELGVSLDENVFPLFSSESALYLRPGLPIPEVTLVTQVDDEQAAMATMDKLAHAVTEYDTDARLDSFQTGGVQARRLSVNRFVSVYYGAVDGKLVVTTSQQGIADVESGENRLADDEEFKDATSAAGMPAETTGFLYTDLSRALPAVLGLAGASGMSMPDRLGANLEPLHSLVLYGTRDADVAKFQGLLAIQ